MAAIFPWGDESSVMCQAQCLVHGLQCSQLTLSPKGLGWHGTGCLIAPLRTWLFIQWTHILQCNLLRSELWLGASLPHSGRDAQFTLRRQLASLMWLSELQPRKEVVGQRTSVSYQWPSLPFTMTCCCCNQWCASDVGYLQAGEEQWAVPAGSGSPT